MRHTHSFEKDGIGKHERTLAVGAAVLGATLEAVAYVTDTVALEAVGGYALLAAGISGLRHLMSGTAGARNEMDLQYVTQQAQSDEL